MSAKMKRRLDLLEKATASMTLFDRTRVPFNKNLAGQSAMVQLCAWLALPAQDHLYGIKSEVKP